MSKKRQQGRLGWRLHLDKIISIWKEKGQSLSFMEIHREFVKRGIVSDSGYKTSTTRILKSLIKEGYVEKDEDSRYRLKISPKPFDAIRKATELRDKYGEELIYEWYVGGAFWSLAEGLILGLPRSVEKNSIYREVLNVLLIRLARIFEAIRHLAIEARTYEYLGKDIRYAPLPLLTLREYLLNILSYILGERSGSDHDGFLPPYIHTVNKIIAGVLPDEIHDEPVDKEELYRLIRLGERIMEQLRTSRLSYEEFMKLIKNEKVNDFGKVLLIVYPSGAYIDEKYEVRQLYEMLTYLLDKGYSDASLLAQMKWYDEEIVEEVLGYLSNIIGRKRVEELKRIYRIMRAGSILDEIIGEYLRFEKEYDKFKDLPEMVEEGDVILFNKYSGKSREEILSNIRSKLERSMLKYGYTLQEMITGIWFGDWPLNPGPRYIPYFVGKSRLKIGEIVEIILKTLDALGIDAPSNLYDIVKQGHDLLIKLENMHKRDATMDIELDFN